MACLEKGWRTCAFYIFSWIVTKLGPRQTPALLCRLFRRTALLDPLLLFVELSFKIESNQQQDYQLLINTVSGLSKINVTTARFLVKNKPIHSSFVYTDTQKQLCIGAGQS